MKREDYLAVARKLNKVGGPDPVVGGGLPEHYSGDLTIVTVASKTEKVQGNDWLPVDCTDSDGNSVRLSAMKIVNARGLKWKSQYLADRLASLVSGTTVNVTDYIFEDATGSNGAYKKKTLHCTEQQMPEPVFDAESTGTSRRRSR